MTIGEYINGKFNIWSVQMSAESIALDLSCVGLDAESEMTADVNTDEYFYRVLPDILLMPTSVSEGGFSISYDKSAITSYYSLMAKRLGKPNMLSSNTIKDISQKW